MRYLLTMIVICLSFLSRAQGDFKLLKKELASFTDNDTVIVFGTFCASCNGFSQSKYYLSKTGESKMFIANYQNGKSKKIFDTTFKCLDCTAIIKYAKRNNRHISAQFDSSDNLLAYNRISGHDTTFSIIPAQGECYFLGIYTNGDFIYSFFRKRQNINQCFDKGNYFWTYYSLLKNQWMHVD